MIRLIYNHTAYSAGDYFSLQLQGKDAGPDTLLSALSPLDAPPPAQWVGSALPLVGLNSQLAPAATHLVRLARGRHPLTEAKIAPVVNRSRAFYDLVVTAPKTVSLAALLLPDHPVARRVMRAHVWAVRCVAEEVGRWMIRGQSLTAPRASGWLGAIFVHTHSREDDPHLHCHVIFPNLMLNPSQQWRAMQIVIAGNNRLRLELLYGHLLARGLRRAGLGEELRMRSAGLPELRCLYPSVRLYSRARLRLVRAAEAAESEMAQPAKAAEVAPSEILPDYPIHPRRAALQRQHRLADRTRPEKSPTADDPSALNHEARRWISQLPDDQRHTLWRMFDRAPVNTRQERAASKVVPALNGVFLRAACARLPAETRQTGPVIMQAAVRASVGQHAWQDLRQVCREFVAARKKRWIALREALDERIIDRERERLAHALPRTPTMITVPASPALAPSVAPVSSGFVPATPAASTRRGSKRRR